MMNDVERLLHEIATKGYINIDETLLSIPSIDDSWTIDIAPSSFIHQEYLLEEDSDAIIQQHKEFDRLLTEKRVDYTKEIAWK